ncbi:PREDICTED: uncharacterized protein LOC104825946 [Tarenaya hassleriana]|uniref:uncharacterized protein LOC104825946 n=1 Tax=Tarenaya hassleriana TaxID=28532 RepID=UPI00053C689C|nr:PREDICTED: uncharacterized protein LOC104825946 [Tarenaya hassleriana]
MVNLQNPSDGGDLLQPDSPSHSDDLEFSSSACSTPFVSAPSSPECGSPHAAAVISGGCFFSAPASPMHYALTSSPSATCPPEPQRVAASSLFEFEFEFSSRFSESGDFTIGSMSSADELFLNGHIRPMKLSSHLERQQILAPLADTEGDNDGESIERGRDLKLQSRSLHRTARSLSPFRSAALQRPEEENHSVRDRKETMPENDDMAPGGGTTPSSLASSSSSRSSSSGRNSKKWISLKEFLHRSKSEGRNNEKEKFWSSVVFSPSKEKKLSGNTNNAKEIDKQKPKQREKKKESKQPRKSPAAKRGVQVSAHELHYTTNRAQAEEMKKRTYLPYRQGLFGCLGFSSKGYSTVNGLAKTLSPVSST